MIPRTLANAVQSREPERFTVPVIESYLVEVSSLLPGPGRNRDGIIAELRAGLEDAADAHGRAGLPLPAAASAAVDEFGPPAEVAAAFRPELAASKARRVALALLTTGPLVGLMWAAAAFSSHLGIRAAPPWQWAGAPPAAPVAFPLFGIALLVTVWTTLITVACTGRLSRWLPDRPRFAPTTAGIAGFGAASADLLLLALLVSQLVAAPGKLSIGPVALAASASAVRLVLARRSGGQCLALRVSLPRHAAL
jgi:hypothetical protein